MRRPDGLLKTLRRIEGCLVLLSIACCVLIIVFIDIDIVARTANRSSYFASELNPMLFSLLIYLAAPEVTRRNDHIGLTFIYSVSPQWLSVLAKRSTAILSAIYFMALAYLFYIFVDFNYLSDARTQGLMNLPVYYTQFAVFGGITLTALRFVINAWFPGNDEDPSDASTDLYLS